MRRSRLDPANSDDAASSALFSTSSSLRSQHFQPPAPSPARFIRHPQPRSTGFTALSNASSSIPSSSVRTAIRSSPSVTVAGSSRRHSKAYGDDDPLSDTETMVMQPLSRHKHKNSDSYTLHHRIPHNPVPAIEVFKRDAPPLHLPDLDKHLASIPRPEFADRQSNYLTMFSPMDKLVASKLSLDDLEHNGKVAPGWRSSLLSDALSTVLGAMGSSLITTYYSLTGVANTVQIFALIISTLIPMFPEDIPAYWRELLLGTIPNVLALNFASGVIPSLIFLLVFMCLAGILLYYFRRTMLDCERYKIMEGLQSPKPSSQWGAILVTFLLTLIYLPLSTLSVHVLVWSSDLWVVENPYINATSIPPALPPLGPPNEYRDPLDFCWTTSMKKNEINFAPLAVVGSFFTIVFLTFWFPISLLKVVKRSIPRIDKFNSSGRVRSSMDMDHEYQLLIERDKNPFAFLYIGFRRELAYFQPFYLFIKLSALIIVAVFTPDNCLFRHVSRNAVTIVSQAGLCLFTILLFLLQCFSAPFINPVNNASEWIGRLNFVFTSAIALATACNAPGKEILNNYVLWVIYALTYVLTFYWVVIGLDFVQRWIKWLASRVDFSIDIFSPRLDAGLDSNHLKRRIWQESVTTLLLTNKDCKIPPKQSMLFAQSRTTDYPPYLLGFLGSPGERHVENLKILAEIGYNAYHRAVNLLDGPDSHRFRRVAETIQRHYVGPDSYWRPNKHIPNCHRYWGHSWWIPFPRSLVMHYDDGPIVVLSNLEDLEKFIAQNSRADIQKRRQVRLALRALDGRKVYWPYEHITPIGSASNWWCCGRGYTANRTRYVDRGILKIRRHGYTKWKGIQLASGFDIDLTYNRGIIIHGEDLGINEDLDLTPPLAQFLGLNEAIIESRLPGIESAIQSYREHLWNETRWKADVLSYGFLVRIYDRPRDPTGVAHSSISPEKDIRVRQLLLSNEKAFEDAYARYHVVTRSQTTSWWYIFWDDFWRRNHQAFSELKTHEADFSPYYPTSIAYTPLPRAALESFLVQRGLMSKTKGGRKIFHSGFLNKIYARLNDTVYEHGSHAVMFHLGQNPKEFDMDDIDLEVNAGPSTLGTGGGTDYDVSDMLPRPEYRWEGLLSDPLREHSGHRSLFAKTKAWLGLSPVWRDGAPTAGIALDVVLRNGRYIIIDNDNRRHENCSPPLKGFSTWPSQDSTTLSSKLHD